MEDRVVSSPERWKYMGNREGEIPELYKMQVLYHMFEGYSHIGAANLRAIDVVSGIASFFVVGIGGTVIGLLFGLTTSFVSRFTEHVPVIEPLLILTMGYLSYLTAEAFHLSGILACTFCGISMKLYVEKNVSRKSNTTTKYVLKMLASVSETIIFVFLGLSTVNDLLFWSTAFILLTLALCLLFRAIIVIALSAVANTFRVQKLSAVEQFIMSYGGLRGAIAFSLVILLNNEVFPQKRVMVTATLVLIYFTVFVQGVTIKPLVNLLRVEKASDHKRTMNEQIHTRVIDHLMAGIEDIAGSFGHHELRARFEYFNSKYLKRLLVREKEKRMRGLSLLHMCRRMSEQDAHEYISRNGSFLLNTNPGPVSWLYRSFSQCSMNGYERMNHHGYMPSHGSDLSDLPWSDISGSNTCLDMHVLQSQNTRKMRDDSKIHHILEDAMFKTRHRFSHHHKHILPPINGRAPFHHEVQYHLRHLLSHHYANHNHNGHVNGSTVPRKNVSFAQQPEEAKMQNDCAEMKDPSPQVSETESTSSEDGGITFTARTNSNEDLPLLEPVEPAPCELQLPWERNTGRPPMSSSTSFELPDDEHPQIGEAPSWVDNNEYTVDTMLSHWDDEEEEEQRMSGENREHMAENEPCLPMPWECDHSNGDVEGHARTDPGKQSTELCSPDNESVEETTETLAGFLESCGLVDVAGAPCEPAQSPSDTVDGDCSTTASLSMGVECGTSESQEDLASREISPNLWKTDEEVETPDSEGNPLPWMLYHSEPAQTEEQTDSIEMSNLNSHSDENGKEDSHNSLPWETCDTKNTEEQTDSIVIQKDKKAFDDMMPPPWKLSEPCDIKCSKSAPVEDSHLPLPWENTLPWEIPGSSTVGIPSSHASQEIDSIIPQVSSHSLKLSEASSRHSEPYAMHHQVMELRSRPSDIDLFFMDAEDTELDLDEEQMDVHSRVTKWLLSSGDALVCDNDFEDDLELDCDDELFSPEELNMRLGASRHDYPDGSQTEEVNFAGCKPLPHEEPHVEEKIDLAGDPPYHI